METRLTKQKIADILYSHIKQISGFCCIDQNDIPDIAGEILSQFKTVEPVQRLKDRGLIEDGCTMDEINKICDKVESEEINNLIEHYQRRLKTICPMIASAISRNEKVTKLYTKASCYRTFITELEKIKNNSDNQ